MDIQPPRPPIPDEFIAEAEITLAPEKVYSRRGTDSWYHAVYYFPLDDDGYTAGAEKFWQWWKVGPDNMSLALDRIIELEGNQISIGT